MPPSACCAITKIDKATAMVTAQESAALSMKAVKGREADFEFNVADSKQLQGLRVGQLHERRRGGVRQPEVGHLDSCQTTFPPNGGATSSGSAPRPH